ncbi:BrnT family toxin [uncultured Thiohalocapsa sp.]|uniref:BrnT family toxin n=1 Tax=uncultured Thiohalocapsa sp. TaxID=768990 RepID=UPI0025E7CF61|nr:BrnT family toxin [uncultured Thiohalocapsa sp.]
MRSFEFDPAKSESNRRKHGIDFVEAQVLWVDPDLVEVEARSSDKARRLVVGRICGKHWSAIITMRGERIRIISVRRARLAEIALYEGS